MNDKWEKALKRLQELTARGELVWRAQEGPRALSVWYPEFSREGIVGFPYFAEALGKHIALYEFEFPNVDENDRELMQRFTAIEFVSPRGVLEYAWSFNGNVRYAVRDLLQLVRRKTSGADDFVAQLLDAEEKERKG